MYIQSRLQIRMRITQFKEQFTEDLVSFVKQPLQIPTLTEWDSKRVAAPERHLTLGKDLNLTLDVQIYTLEKENQAFENIASLLRIYMDRTVLRAFPKLDPVKEQVWLFAEKWFSAYYELLTEPDILKSEFFRMHNDDFLSLMAKMLAVQPKHRILFHQALVEWDPTHPSLKKDPVQIDLEPTSQLATSETDAMPSASSSASPKVSWTPLVLSGSCLHEEHNKTRKNPRN